MDILTLRDYRGSDFNVAQKSSSTFWGGEIPTQLYEGQEAVNALNKIKVVLGASQGITVIAPRFVYNLANCIKLDLSSNRIKDLPDELSDMVNLEVLKLHHNRLEKLPDCVCKLVLLRHLNISSNSIIDISSHLTKMTSLEFLDASCNHIADLPKWYVFCLYQWT
jgi:Leucine-rich repeat (LRR) protein